MVLSISIGLPEAFLQSAAWMGMFVKFARQSSLSHSIAMTFDGNHPCRWCKAVQRGNSTNHSKQDVLPGVVKIDLAEPEQVIFLFVPPETSSRPWTTFRIHRLVSRPEIPPPKFA
jgi:hypothetical protein